jgi:TRAP-type C4-dicarboxylate transport system permease small subunit
MEEKRERESVETIMTYVFTAVLIAMLSIQVFMRYVLNRNVTWSEEVSRIAFVWMIYASIAYAAKHDKHIRLSFLLMALPPVAQKVILTIADAIWIGLNLLIVYQSVFYILRLFRYPYISQTLGINLVYTYFIVPLGFLLVTYRIVQNIIKRLRKKELDIHDSRMDL